VANLAGQRALVTGAGTRLGQRIALGLGKAGVRVAVHYHSNAAGAEETCRQIREAGAEAVPLAADLTRRDQARALVDQSIEALGGLDLLVGSAANFERLRFEQLDDEAFDRAIGLNLASQFSLAHQAAPALKASRGNMVFITCSSATVPFRNYLPYVVSKGALRHMVKTLSLELAPEVRVNAVAPGTVLPEAGMAESALSRVVERIPLGRTGEAEDVVEAVLYLATASFVTGHELVVDGGRSVAAFERF
jgi:pteridine reductase